MIALGGIVITAPIIWAILAYGTICLIQPWSMTFKTIGAGIGICAYGFLPFVVAGAVS